MKPIVRPPEKTYATTALLLDLGAMGFMFQGVESAEEAKEIVSWTRYPGEGRRGAMFGGAHDDYAGGDLPTIMKAANERTMVMMMIETERGLANVEEIIALLATCKANGKFAACMAPTIETAMEWMGRGFRMVSYSYDSGLMGAHLAEGLNQLREV